MGVSFQGVRVQPSADQALAYADFIGETLNRPAAADPPLVDELAQFHNDSPTLAGNRKGRS